MTITPHDIVDAHEQELLLLQKDGNFLLPNEIRDIAKKHGVVLHELGDDYNDLPEHLRPMTLKQIFAAEAGYEIQ